MVSFPSPTKMLPFGELPLRVGAPWSRRTAVGGPIQVSQVRRLHAPTLGGFAACRALLRFSSRAILQTAWHVWVVLVFVWRLVKLLLCRFLRVCGVIELVALHRFAPVFGDEEVHVVFWLLSLFRSALRTYKCCVHWYKRLLWCRCGAKCGGFCGFWWRVRFGMVVGTVVLGAVYSPLI